MISPAVLSVVDGGSRMAAPLPQTSCSVGQLWNWVLVVSESPLLQLLSQETSRASVYLQSGGRGKETEEEEAESILFLGILTHFFLFPRQHVVKHMIQL